MEEGSEIEEDEVEISRDEEDKGRLSQGMSEEEDEEELVVESDKVVEWGIVWSEDDSGGE
jgi:hypothetical protein